MRLKDIINEGARVYRRPPKEFGTTKNIIDPAIPNVRIEPSVRNTDTYMHLRYGMALAAAAAQQDSEWEQESAWSENFITLGYTDAEQTIVDNADKLMGVSGVKLSGRSQEHSDVGTKSPVADTSWRKTSK